MINKYSFFILGFCSLFLWSCADSNPFTPSDDIDGPRVLQTVTTKDGTVVENYEITSYGILRKINFKNQTFNLNYLGNTLKEIIVTGSSDDFPLAEKMIIAPNYNSAGQVSSITNDIYQNGIVKYREVTTVEYNNLGNPTSLFSVRFDVATSNTGTYQYTAKRHLYNNISYQGNNISGIERIINTINTSGAITETVTTNIKYEEYDWRPNPYKTLSKHFMIIMASYSPEYVYNLSANNASTKKTTTQNAGQNTVTYSYAHDKYAYPTTNGYVNYRYQAIP